MRAYLKLLAVVGFTVVCFAIVRTPVARDLWLGQKWAWAQAYGSPRDLARVQDECTRIWAEESGDPGALALYEFGRRWRQVIALYVAAGATPSEAAVLATEAAVRERVAVPLGLSLEEAAIGIIDILDALEDARRRR